MRAEMTFTLAELGAVRRAAALIAHNAELEAQRRDDFVLAVSELATNSICHGGGEGRMRVWRDDQRLSCEVLDRGYLPELPTDRSCPGPEAVSGRGLWLVLRLCDRVQVSSSRRAGTSVCVQMLLG